MDVLTLENDLGIEHCSLLKETLATCLDSSPLQVDAGAVERLHAASLQLLVAWLRDRTSAGLDTRWSACSDALHAAARSLGLEAALDLPAPAAQPHNALEEPA
ncbi:STAS domain-containing protein [Luteimonas sp. A478]